MSTYFERMQAQFTFDQFKGLIVYADKDEIPQQVFFFPMDDISDLALRDVKAVIYNAPVGHFIYFKTLRNIIPGLEQILIESDYRILNCVSNDKEFKGRGRYFFAYLWFMHEEKERKVDFIGLYPKNLSFQFGELEITRKIIGTEGKFFYLVDP